MSGTQGNFSGNSAGSDARVGFICRNGVSYACQWWLDEGGNLRDIRAIDGLGGVFDPRAAGTPWTWGTCLATQNDLFRIVTALTFGNNIIVHNMGALPVGSGFATEVEVRNVANGALVSVRVVAETANSVTIFTPVPLAIARISIDV